jgi:hypothetical protein
MACVSLATLVTCAASAQQGEMLAWLLLLLLLCSAFIATTHLAGNQCRVVIMMAADSCAGRLHQPAHTV